ncbi:MAG: hypothetical protein MUE60_15935 [Candidatus Eisenbacteria bacterium]|jgi:hypothetical protein|nr:hypothetical protein [Candidatus Eisenbacteria bacterium]
MRKSLLGLLVLGLLGASSAAFSYGFGCGLKPLPPLGCRYDAARCYCDDEGNCQWIWEC